MTKICIRQSIKNSNYILNVLGKHPFMANKGRILIFSAFTSIMKEMVFSLC